jgi:hypothetical protein
VVETVTLSLSSENTSVSVISVAPLPGSTISRDDVPMNVQTASMDDIANGGALDFSEFMNRKLTGLSRLFSLPRANERPMALKSTSIENFDVG